MTTDHIPTLKDHIQRMSNDMDEMAAEITKLRDENTALLRRLDRLLIWGDELDALADAPDKNCSCHLCPPCNDCVEFGGIREAKEGWKHAKEYNQ